MKKTSTAVSSSASALSLSPVHNLIPLNSAPQSILVSKIVEDETNPGSVVKSQRDTRRTPSIADSYDILGKIIYPLILHQKGGAGKEYEIIDGHGRFREAQKRSATHIDAIIFPHLTLEQKICLRETLNAAQEPFDAVSIIADLRLLAKERHLNISKEADIKKLLSDFPERVRKHEADLMMLARFDPKAVEMLGESYDKKEQGTVAIGLDKFRELNSVVKVMEEYHPEVIKKMGGTKKLTYKLATMYKKRKFSDGIKSQQGIRHVAKALKLIDDDKAIEEFFTEEKSFKELAPIKDDKGRGSLINLCKNIQKYLKDIDASKLTSDERQELKRTSKVLREIA